MYQYPQSPQPEPYPTWPQPAPPAKSTALVVVLAVSIVIAVVALGACGVLGWRLLQLHGSAGQEQSLHMAADDAQQAAIDFARVLTSIDYTKIDDNIAAVLDGATGEFKDQYSASSSQLRQTLVANKAIANGKAIDSAIETQSEEESWCCCS